MPESSKPASPAPVQKKGCGCKNKKNASRDQRMQELQEKMKKIKNL